MKKLVQLTLVFAMISSSAFAQEQKSSVLGQRDLCFANALQDALALTPFRELSVNSITHVAMELEVAEGVKRLIEEELHIRATDISGREYRVVTPREYASMGDKITCRVSSALISDSEGKEVFSLVKWNEDSKKGDAAQQAK